MRDEEPIWRPVTDVATLTEIARQGVEHAREQRDMLVNAGPYRLDDETVARILRVVRMSERKPEFCVDHRKGASHGRK